MSFQKGDSFLNAIMQEEDLIKKFIHKVEEDLHENEPPEPDALMNDTSKKKES